jgi:hypothetical protein
MAVKVYAIRNRTSEGVYIGTTTKQYLSQRWAHHTHGARKHQEGKPIRWCSSFQILACPTASIELLEECSEDMRKERERHWIETTPNCVNKHYKPKTEEEKDAKRRHDTERMRQWREANPDRDVENSRRRRADPAVRERENELQRLRRNR